MNTRILTLPLALLAATLALAGCGRDSASASTADTAAANPAQKSYPIRGEIVELDRPRQVLIIHHEEIPGYMPAMTMEFNAPGLDFAQFRVGQKLAALMGPAVDAIFPLTGIRFLDTKEDAAVADAARKLREDTFTRGKNAFREVGEAAPVFTLYNQNGAAVRFEQFRGQRVVLNFIFTRCPVATMCPASTAKMMALQAAAKARNIPNLQLVSISFDSAYDTPPVLKAYADARGIDTSNFSFLTGPENAIRDLLAQFGVIAEPGENVFKHTLSTILIGADGKILHRADGSAWEPSDFLTRL
jgi:protein SCO1/2